MAPKNTVSAFDAKTHLSRLLVEVEEGNVITITRRGKPVAQLVPVKDEEKEVCRKDLLRGFDAIRSRIKESVNTQELIDEGRKR
jgi:prevent-host-death family protein